MGWSLFWTMVATVGIPILLLLAVFVGGLIGMALRGKSPVADAARAVLQTPAVDALQAGLVKPAVAGVLSTAPVAREQIDRLLRGILNEDPMLYAEAVQMGLISPDPAVQQLARSELNRMANADAVAPAETPAKATA